jgi:vacuolar-type H+-ATPase subunit E/Vma4
MEQFHHDIQALTLAQLLDSQKTLNDKVRLLEKTVNELRDRLKTIDDTLAQRFILMSTRMDELERVQQTIMESLGIAHHEFT